MNSFNEAIIAQSLFKDAPIHFKMAAIGTPTTRSLLPKEKLFFEKLGEKRKKEFQTSRIIIQELLEKIGHSEWPLVPLDERAPKFPDTLCGSLAHTHKYCLAAVAHKKNIVSIGIDAEIKDRLQPKLWSACLTPHEVHTLHTFTNTSFNPQSEFRIDPIVLATFIFSAKESFYKYQYPLTQAWVGFMDVEITSLPTSLNNNEFVLKLLKPIGSIFKANQLILGNATLTDEVVITAIYSSVEQKI